METESERRRKRDRNTEERETEIREGESVWGEVLISKGRMEREEKGERKETATEKTNR